MEDTNKSIVIRVSVIAALAGLLFGLDVAFVNGALGFIARDFNLTIEQSGMVAGYLLAGAAFGAFISGFLARFLGRKKTLVLSAAMFTLFIGLSILTYNFDAFLSYRFIIGIAIGIASFVAPLYLSEIAPYKIRGALIAIYQLMITAGIFLMFVSNAELAYTGSWRIMMSVLIIPALIMLVGAFTLPESPRWKALVGKFDDAQQILLKIRNTKAEVDFELNEIKNTLKHDAGGISLLTHGYFLKVLVLGILLQALQQFCGMNAFMYYSGQIFAAAGFSNPMVGTVVIGLVNLLTTILAVKYVDKWGRKPILYFGLILLVLACAAVGYIFNVQVSGVALSPAMQYLLLASCLLFIFGFAISLGPIIWIVCPEIFPLKGREFGVTVTTMTNWICNSIIGGFTLSWFIKFGVGNTFWLFGLVSFVGIFLVKFFTPETKDLPLEELEANLKGGQPLRLLGHRTRVE